VRGIADEHHATALPLVEFHPLHGRAVDLLVARERDQVLRHWPPECREAGAQPFKPTDLRIVEARLGDIPKAIGVSVAYGHQPKEAFLA